MAQSKKKRYALALVGAALLCLPLLSHVGASERGENIQSKQESVGEVAQTPPVQEETVSRPYHVLPPEKRRLSQETIDQIDNLTIQQFVQFYNDTGLDVPYGGPSYLEDVSDDHWFLPSNNYVEGEYPIIGSNCDGGDQGWDNYLDGDRWTTLSYADHTKSATAGQIKQALRDYFYE